MCGHQAGITQVKRGRSGTEPSRPLQCTCCPPLGSAAPKGGPRAPSLEPRAPPSWSLQPHPGRGPSGAVGGGPEQGSPCPVTEARGLGRGPERAGLAGEAFAEVYVVSPEVLGTCTGCLVRAVEMAAQRQADIIGKPSRFIFDCVSQEYGINPERTVMVGDRLDTDILLGVTCGLKTILTLTGVSTLGDVKSNRESDCMNKKRMVPDFYVDSIADLLPALQG